MSSPDMGVGTIADKQEETARLGTFSRLIGTIFSPGETFQDINRKPDWIVPIIVAIIFAIGGGLIIKNRLNLDPEKVARQAIEQSLQQRGKSISDLTDQQKEGIEKQVQMSVKIQKVLPALQVVFIPIFVALLSLLFWGAGILLGVALLPVLTSPGGLLSRIDQQWLAPTLKAADSETRELAIGFLAVILFSLALVVFENLRR